MPDEIIDDDLSDEDEVFHPLTEEQSQAIKEHMHKFATDPEYRKMCWQQAIQNSK